MSRGKDVHFHDRFIPNEEAEIFFKGCDVLCLPYRQIYQSGLVFLGPRFGIPMVTTDVGELREFMGEALGIVTETNDTAGIAKALTKFLSTSEKFSQAEIFSRGVQYQWPIVCRGLLPLYAGHYKASTPQAAGVRAIAPREGTCSSERGTNRRFQFQKRS